MPRKEKEYTCHCEECILTGGSGPDGKPLGVTMPYSHRVPHLNRVRTERASLDIQQNPLPNTIQTVSPSIPDPIPQLSNPSVSSSTPLPHASDIIPNIAKRERNHNTTKAHTILESIMSRTKTCILKITSPAYEVSDLPDLEQDLSYIWIALNKVERDVPSVVAHKRTVKERVNALQEKFDEIRKKHPESAETVPLLYNSGT
jgi:hypothetical protein